MKIALPPEHLACPQEGETPRQRDARRAQLAAWHRRHPICPPAITRVAAPITPPPSDRTLHVRASAIAQGIQATPIRMSTQIPGQARSYHYYFLVRICTSPTADGPTKAMPLMTGCGLNEQFDLLKKFEIKLGEKFDFLQEAEAAEILPVLINKAMVPNTARLMTWDRRDHQRRSSYQDAPGLLGVARRVSAANGFVGIALEDISGDPDTIFVVRWVHKAQ